MIKLAFLIRSLNCGGAERSLITLIKALEKSRFDITVFHFYSGGELLGELEQTGVKVVCLGKSGRWDFLRFYVRLIRHLRRLRPDVLHSYLVESNLIAVFAKPFLARTRIVWGVRTSRISIRQYDRFTRLIYWVQNRVSRFADLIIFNSYAGQRYHLTKGFPREKSLVIHNGIDIDLFQPDIEGRKRLRAEWGFDDAAILIGMIGRADPMKDLASFLNAAEIVSNSSNTARFVCVGVLARNGNGHSNGQARKLTESGRLIWAGRRAEMAPIYSALDVLCSPSASGEGFPNAIGEAMACGLPCVVTNVGDSAVIVGDAGVVVEPQDPKALARGLISCLDERRHELGARAYSRVRENWSAAMLAEQTEQAINGLQLREGSA